MASSDQRDSERVPTFLRVRLKFADLDTFIDKYSTNVSLGGIFIQSRSPKPPGTLLRFELSLESGEPVIRGEGQVTWVKEFDPGSPGQPFGMGVRFTSLDPKSRAVVERAVARRQSRGGPGTEPGLSPTTPPITRPAAQPRRPTPTAKKDVRWADAELAALMREAGLTEEQVSRAARSAAALIGADDLPAGLRALLSPGVPAAPHAAPEASPPLAPRGRGRKRTPVPVEPPGRTTAEPVAFASAAPRPPPPEPLRAPAGLDEPAMAELDRALEAALTPAPIPEDRDGQVVLDFTSADRVEEDSLEGMDLALESLGDRPAESIDQAVGGQLEITAVGTPPRFEESPEEEPSLFPDRDLLTPPPEAAPPLFSQDASATPPEPMSEEQPPVAVQAADRWAAASGPETANLDAELHAALDSVIDRSTPEPAAEVRPQEPAPAARATGPTPSPPHEPEKKGKSLLGRLFRKKS